VAALPGRVLVERLGSVPRSLRRGYPGRQEEHRFGKHAGGLGLE
jgi:hypothetical protein